MLYHQLYIYFKTFKPSPMSQEQRKLGLDFDIFTFENSKVFKRVKAKISVRNSVSHTTVHLNFSNLITLRQGRGIKILSSCRFKDFCLMLKFCHLFYTLQLQFILWLSPPIKSAELHCSQECFCLIL